LWTLSYLSCHPFFFYNPPSPTHTYTLSLHDALPIYCHINNNYTFTAANTDCYGCHQTAWQSTTTLGGSIPNHVTAGFLTSMCSRSEEHTSELQSRGHLVCRLLLEKKKKKKNKTLTQ